MSEVINFQEKRTEAALKKCRNQSGGSIEIIYKDAKILAPAAHLEDAIEALSADNQKRLRVMRSVNEYLRRNFKKTMDGKASQKVAMKVSQDILIWYANKLLMEEEQQ